MKLPHDLPPLEEINRAHLIAEKFYLWMVQQFIGNYHSWTEQQGMHRAVAESVLTDAANKFLASVITFFVALGKGLPDEETKKLAEEINKKVHEFVTQLTLEQGATITTIDTAAVSDEPKAGETLDILFTNSEAPGAIPNGTVVEKVVTESNDGHKVGDRATVLGSIGPKDFGPHKNMYGYFVRWEDSPLPVFIAGYKIKPVPEGEKKP